MEPATLVVGVRACGASLLSVSRSSSFCDGGGVGGGGSGFGLLFFGGAEAAREVRGRRRQGQVRGLEVVHGGGPREKGAHTGGDDGSVLEEL